MHPDKLLAHAQLILPDFNVCFPDRISKVRQIFEGKTGENPSVREVQLSQFLRLVDSFAFELRRAWEENRVMTIAWLARNLLELHIWIRFCNISDENSERFSSDSARDFIGYTKGLERLEKVTGSEALATELRERFTAFAKNDLGLTDIDDKFMPVLNAANELGGGQRSCRDAQRCDGQTSLR